MTPLEISEQLPNGFHGAIVQRISIDYISKKVEFMLKLLVPDTSNMGGHSRLRGGRFEVNGLAYFSLEKPDPNYDYQNSRGVEIGSLLETTAKICPDLPRFRSELGASFFFHSFFVEDWNRFIHFAGTGAKFDWVED